MKKMIVVMVLVGILAGCSARKTVIVHVPVAPGASQAEIAKADEDALRVEKLREQMEKFNKDQGDWKAKVQLVCPNDDDGSLYRKVRVYSRAANQGALFNRVFVQVRATVPRFNGSVRIDSPDGTYVENMCPGGSITLIRRLVPFVEGNQIQWWWEAHIIPQDGPDYMVRSGFYNLNVQNSSYQTKQYGSWIINLQPINPTNRGNPQETI